MIFRLPLGPGGQRKRRRGARPLTLTLYEHPFAAYCWKALIALDELGIPCERRLVGDAADRGRLAALWPMASVPVLVDEAAGVTLPESTAIVEYLDGLGSGPRLIPEHRGGRCRRASGIASRTAT